jgi:hypothetical protein
MRAGLEALRVVVISSLEMNMRVFKLIRIIKKQAD